MVGSEYTLDLAYTDFIVGIRGFLDTEDAARLLEVTATELGATEETATELGATELGVLDLLEELGATEATELLAGGGVVPQPIGWVETTISSIHTSALRLLKLWKPNIT